MREFLDRVQAAVSDDGRLSVTLLASPEGVLRLRGSNRAAWADMLPPTPAEELEARAARVRDALARAG